MIKSNTNQERKVLDVLMAADGGWVNGRYFKDEMYLSQYHRAIWNLQNKRERYEYEGDIVPSDFTDEHGFKSYRIAKVVPVSRPVEQVSLI